MRHVAIAVQAIERAGGTIELASTYATPLERGSCSGSEPPRGEQRARMVRAVGVPEDLQRLYHVREWRNATGVLETACPDEWREIVEILSAFRLLRS